MEWLMCFISVMVEMMKDILVTEILIGIKITYKRIITCLLLSLLSGCLLYTVIEYNFFLFFIFPFIIIYIFTETNFKKYVQASIVEFLLISLIDMMIWLLLNATTVLGDFYFLNKGIVALVEDILGLFFWIFLLLALKYKKKIIQEYFFNVGGKAIFLIILAIGFFSLILAFVQGMFMDELNLAMKKFIMVASVFVTFFLLLICGYLVYSIVSKMHLEEINSLNERCLFYQKEYYGEMLRRNEELSAFKHDIDKHFKAIQMLVSENKYEELNKYMTQFGTFTGAEALYKTGNLMADYIINGKIKEISTNQEVKVNVLGKFPIDCKVSDFDLCVILTNALDNVKEAVEVVKEKPKIEINIRNTKGKIYLLISNTSNPRKTKNLETTKLDIREHGYGIKNIKKVIEKYNGLMDIEYTKGMFILQIVL